jgi:hypothetical protein
MTDAQISTLVVYMARTMFCKLIMVKVTEGHEEINIIKWNMASLKT